MSLKTAFRTNAGKLHDAIVQNDLLAAARLAGQLSSLKLSETLDATLGAAMTPQMAAVISGPNGVSGRKASGDDSFVGPPFKVVLSSLLNARNIKAAEVVIRKEKDGFNGPHGTEVMIVIAMSPVSDEDKLRLLKVVLAGGHNRMIFPERAAFFASNGGFAAIAEPLRALIGKTAPYVPQPTRTWA